MEKQNFNSEGLLKLYTSPSIRIKLLQNPVIICTSMESFGGFVIGAEENEFRDGLGE